MPFVVCDKISNVTLPSGSETVSVPVILLSSVAVPDISPVIVGTSLTDVTIIVITCVVVKFAASVSVTVNWSVPWKLTFGA